MAVDMWPFLGAALLIGGGAVLAGAFAMELRPHQPVDASSPLMARANPHALVRWAVTLTGVALVVGTVWHSFRYVQNPVFITLWCVTAALMVASLLAHAVGRRHLHRPIAAGRVLAVVPAFNEPSENLYACVRSLLSQTVPLDIVVVDDGSLEPVAGRWHDRVRWVYQPNAGKAGAQVSVLRMFRPDEYDFILTVDSDSVLYPDAAEHLLRAMSHPRVWAATGWMYVRNHAASLVTIAADIEIGISCVMGRASRSVLGALESTSGALALYRAALVYDHLEEYAANPHSIDDDRWLTTRALRRGQVVAVHEAVVATDMPETLSATWRQRTRWARSWLLSLPYVARRLGVTAKVWPAVSLAEIVTTPAIVVYGILTFVVPVLRGYPVFVTRWEVAAYVSALAAVRFCQSALYLIERPYPTRGAKLHAWVFGTLGEIFLSTLLLPAARYYAMVRVRDASWGSRGSAAVDAPTRVTASAMVPPHRYAPTDPAHRTARTPAPRPPADGAGRHAASNEVTMLLPALRGGRPRAGSRRATGGTRPPPPGPPGAERSRRP